ncbi:MAG: SNF2-related protein, partial [Planctomycetota bacterium]
MARRRRRGSSPTNSGNNASAFHRLAALINGYDNTRQAPASRSPRAGVDGPLFDASNILEALSKNAADPGDWFEAARSLLTSLPVTRWYQNVNSIPNHGAVITDVYQRGLLLGAFRADGEDLKMYVQLGLEDGQRPTLACGCNFGSPGVICKHLVQFVNFIDDKLMDGRSSLCQRIMKGDWTVGNPDLNLAKDVVNLISNRLSALTTSFDLESDNDAERLDVVAQKALERLAYRFEYSDDDAPRVEILLQQRKKRGDGFTKGRKLSVDKLMGSDTYRHLINSVDEKLLNGQREFLKRVGNQLTWNAVSAATFLIDDERVFLNDEPCVVEPLHYEIALAPTKEGGFKFGVHARDCPPGEQMHFSDTNVVHFDVGRSVIRATKLSSATKRATEMLLTFPSIQPDQVSQILPQLTQLAKHVSIRLPESLAGKVETSVFRPAVLLRSMGDGMLQCGLRVRRGDDRLYYPGSSPARIYINQTDRLRQIHHDLETESAWAERSAQQFGLTLDDDANAVINDLDVSLQLIEWLQNPETDVETLWDRDSEKPMQVLGGLSSNNVRVDITKKRDWFGLSGECQFDNETIPLAELLATMRTGEDGQTGYVRVGEGAWARISQRLQKQLQALRDATHTDRKSLRMDATAAPVIREMAGEDMQVKSTKAWQRCMQRLADAEQLQPTVPEHLDATLRDYQVEGYAWLRRLAQWGVGGVLADDMGLGKTLQTLAVLLDRADEGPALVIAPTSVGFNWVREAQRFAPDLDVHLYRETQREQFLPDVGPGSLVICSYGLALRDADALASVAWNTLVLDEAQAIKNSRSKTSRAIGQIDADWTVALTGTPVENHLGELWSLFSVVSPGVFGGWDGFRKRFAAPIERDGDAVVRQSLADRLKPFVLRRTKSEVLTELPPRTEMNLYVDLSPAERKQYDAVRLSALGELEQIESLESVQDQRFKILALMTRLRQIACHAGMVDESWIHGSAKLQQLCETLRDLKSEGHRVLIFSQFVKHLNFIRQGLEENDVSFEYLDGSTPAK